MIDFDWRPKQVVRNSLTLILTSALAASCSFPKGVDHPSALCEDGSVRTAENPCYDGKDLSLTPQDLTPAPGNQTPVPGLEPGSDAISNNGYITDPNTGQRFRVVDDPKIPTGQAGDICAEISSNGQSFISLEDALQAASGRNKFGAYIYDLRPQPYIFNRDQGEQIPAGVVYWAGGNFACAVK
jgi:hypothetical protein